MTTYYVTKENNMYVLRQTRFKESFSKGKEHPHDVCAYGRTLEELLNMVKTYKLGTVDYSEVQA